MRSISWQQLMLHIPKRYQPQSASTKHPSIKDQNGELNIQLTVFLKKEDEIVNGQVPSQMIEKSQGNLECGKLPWTCSLGISGLTNDVNKLKVIHFHEGSQSS